MLNQRNSQRCFASLKMLGARALNARARPVGPNLFSELENDFAATLAARRMRNGRLRFAQWISFLYFRL
jgi:hypothetical protein